MNEKGPEYKTERRGIFRDTPTFNDMGGCYFYRQHDDFNDDESRMPGSLLLYTKVLFHTEPREVFRATQKEKGKHHRLISLLADLNDLWRKIEIRREEVVIVCPMLVNGGNP